METFVLLMEKLPKFFYMDKINEFKKSLGKMEQGRASQSGLWKG